MIGKLLCGMVLVAGLGACQSSGVSSNDHTLEVNTGNARYDVTTTDRDGAATYSIKGESADKPANADVARTGSNRL